MDTISKARRSWNMSRIRSKNTGPERLVRSVLHSLGCRFRLHAANLPGTPDIVLPRWRTVLFVDGCFWHRHRGCAYAYEPKSRKAFWNAKFRANMRRDLSRSEKLSQLGWKCHVVWECETRDLIELERRLKKIFRRKNSSQTAHS